MKYLVVGGDWYTVTQSPEDFPDAVHMIPLVVSGYGYAKKKRSAENLAHTVADALKTAGISLWDCWPVERYFDEIGHRFGLLQAFDRIFD